MPNLNRGSKTYRNLKDAFGIESEASCRYLYFAHQADIEGYPADGRGTLPESARQALRAVSARSRAVVAGFNHCSSSISVRRHCSSIRMLGSRSLRRLPPDMTRSRHPVGGVGVP